MISGQLAMGVMVAALCAAGLAYAPWLLTNTRKGRRLAGWFGERNGLRVLQLLLVAGFVFGVLLAGDVIRPIQWNQR
jgi:hypothetical protein